VRRRVLLIDDEQHIVDVVEYVLKEHGFDVTVALDGDAGLRLFKKAEPDLVVLDLNLPGIAGFDLFGEIRALRADVPVIMLTSRGEEIDRVAGLEMGADDYVTKPFSPRELAARVRAVLRRAEHRTMPDRSASKLTHGPIEIDAEALSLLYFGKRLQLTRAEFTLIERLVRYPARVFTREKLIDVLYDGEHVVTDRSIDAHVKRIRRKFAEVRADLDPIETVHGLGYKLRQELETAE